MIEHARKTKATIFEKAKMGQSLASINKRIIFLKMESYKID